MQISLENQFNVPNYQKSKVTEVPSWNLFSLVEKSNCAL